MAEETPLFVLHLLGFAGFLWLGLYILSRGERGGAATLNGLAALAIAAYFGLQGAVLEALHDASQDTWTIAYRATWWAAVVPLALWLHVTLRLNPASLSAARRRQVLWLTYGATLIFTLLGTFTSSIHRPIGVQHGGDPAPAGSAYVLYVLFLFFCTIFALVNLVRMPRLEAGTADPGSEMTIRPAPDERPQQLHGPEVRLLVAGAAFFLAGAGYESLRALLATGWSEIPSFSLLLIGLGAVGATVAIQSTLLLGTDVRRDVLYSFTGWLILVVPYLLLSGALTGFDDGRHRMLAILVLALITAGHTLYDQLRAWLDAAFFPPPVREERAAARAYVDALATQPAGPSPELATRKAFDDAVRRGLTHLSDPTKLATTPLLSLRVVARGVADQGLEDNRLNRAAVLKEILLETLDGLRPAESMGGITGDAFRFYNCLYYPYVQGVSRRRAPTILRQLQERRRREGTPRSDLERVVDWLLQVDEDTFYKWQRRGSDTIAAALREREAAAGGSVPQESTGTPVAS